MRSEGDGIFLRYPASSFRGAEHEPLEPVDGQSRRNSVCGHVRFVLERPKPGSVCTKPPKKIQPVNRTFSGKQVFIIETVVIVKMTGDDMRQQPGQRIVLKMN